MLSNEITSEVKSIYQLLLDEQLSIPVYQRSYSWQPPEAIKLLTDMQKAYDLGMVGFFGSIVLHTGGTGTVLVLDGQQRLITTALIMAAYKTVIESGDDRMQWFEKLTMHNRDQETLAKRIAKYDASTYEFSNDSDSPNKPVEEIPNLVIVYAALLDWFSTHRDTLNFIKDKEFAPLVCVIRLNESCFGPAVLNSINTAGMRMENIDIVKSLMFYDISEVEQQTLTYNQFWVKLYNLAEKTNIPAETILRRSMASAGANVPDWTHPSIAMESYNQGLQQFGQGPFIQKMIDYVATCTILHEKGVKLGPTLERVIEELRILEIEWVEEIITNTLLQAVVGKLNIEHAAQVLERLKVYIVRAKIFEEEIPALVAQHLKQLVVQVISDGQNNTELETRIEQLNWTLFYGPCSLNTPNNIAEVLLATRCKDMKLVKLLLLTADRKLSKTDVSSDGEVKSVIPINNTLWNEFLHEHGYGENSVMEYYTSFGGRLVDSILVDSELTLKEGDPGEYLGALGRSRYTLTRAVKRNKDFSRAYLTERSEKLSHLISKIYNLPKVSTATIVANSKNSWIRITDIVDTKGLKPTSVRIFDQTYTSKMVSVILKNYKAIAVMAIRTAATEIKKVDPKAEKIKGLLYSKSLAAIDSNMLQSVNSDTAVEIIPGVYWNIGKTSNKIVRQLNAMLIELGMADEVKLKFKE